MLVVTRREQEPVYLDLGDGRKVTVVILKKGSYSRIGIEAPLSVSVSRAEKKKPEPKPEPELTPWEFQRALMAEAAKRKPVTA